MGKAGFLVSAYGTNGGYRLARDPRLISALEVIRAIDGPIVLANCFTEACALRAFEPLHGQAAAAADTRGILRLLESVSIQDMLQDSKTSGGAGPSASSSLVALSKASPNDLTNRRISKEMKYEIADLHG